MIDAKSKIQFFSQYAYKIVPGDNIFVKFWLMILAQYVFPIENWKEFHSVGLLSHRASKEGRRVRARAQMLVPVGLKIVMLLAGTRYFNDLFVIFCVRL